MFARALGIWSGILVLAVLNGGMRDLIVTPRFGEATGHIASTIVLCALIALVTRASIRWIGPASRMDAVLISTSWLTLTLSFELLAGHYLFGNSWARLLADYDVRRGRIWPLVLVTVLFAPMWARERTASQARAMGSPRENAAAVRTA